MTRNQHELVVLNARSYLLFIAFGELAKHYAMLTDIHIFLLPLAANSLPLQLWLDLGEHVWSLVGLKLTVSWITEHAMHKTIGSLLSQHCTSICKAMTPGSHRTYLFCVSAVPCQQQMIATMLSFQKRLRSNSSALLRQVYVGALLQPNNLLQPNKAGRRSDVRTAERIRSIFKI